MQPLSLSTLGQQMSSLTGVRAIMKDIIETLRSNQDRQFINLSAGNPVILPQVEQLWREASQRLLEGDDYGSVVCRYGASQGYEPLIAAVQANFQRHYGITLSDRQILITPGSQALYFVAANAFGGKAENGTIKKIVLPLSPDYTGYGGVSVTPEAVVSYRPTLDLDPPNHRFKYRPDFEQIQINSDTGCVIFSRPCNPTGNVLSDRETRDIVDLAGSTPVFIDSAYGAPFPGLHYQEMQPLLCDQAPNVVHCMSLSKAGLPGERVGIAIGNEQIIQTLEAFQTNLCIHSSRYGQAIAADAIESGRLSELAQSVIRPHYAAKLSALEEALKEHMPDDVPWYLHRVEGSIFGWIWFQDCPVTDWDIYQRLKAAGVIVVPGRPFFPGLQETWAHTQQCLRISLTGS
ncbi:MAG: valine--pyruvate transaminase, partial [Cyanobacteria bacterium P01_F01_bin.42]